MRNKITIDIDTDREANLIFIKPEEFTPTTKEETKRTVDVDIITLTHGLVDLILFSSENGYGVKSEYINFAIEKLNGVVEVNDKILWLDDYRNPYLNIEGRVPSEKGTIEWVLNYDEFVEWINKYGLPRVISFDHDLADEHYTPEEYWVDFESNKKYQESQVYKEKTGMDCAKWLVNYCIDNKKPLPIFYVHSANPVGAENIRSYLTNFLKNN